MYIYIYKYKYIYIYIMNVHTNAHTQLRCGGVIEAMKMARASYPCRFSHREFLNTYEVCVCLYVCVYVCFDRHRRVRISALIWMHACMRVCVHACMICVFIHIIVCVYAMIHTHNCMYV